MKAHAIPPIVTIFVFCSTVSAASATEFRRVDPGAFYERFSFAIDLLILLFLFTAITHATLGSRLGGRGGRALSLTVGLALAVSLSLMARERGLNLRSFGLVGAILLFALFAVAIYRLLSRTGTAKGLALSAVLAFTLLALTATIPAFADWIREQTPWLGGALLLLLLLSLAYLTTGLIRPDRRKLRRAKGRRDRDHSKGKGNGPSLTREKDAVKRSLRPKTKRLRKASAKWKRATRSLRSLKRSGQNASAKIPEVAAETELAIAEVAEARESVAGIRDLTERMKRLDESLLTDKSRENLQQMSPQSRSLIKRSWRDEIERLGVEQKAERIEDQIERHLLEVGARFGEALRLLKLGRIAEASEQARQAERARRALRRLIRLLEGLEKYLLSLVKADITIEASARRLPPPPGQ